MATGSAENNVGTTGGSGASGSMVGWRDAYTTLGAAELLNNWGSSGPATATAGNITTGDRILGGTKKTSLGLVKVLALFAGVAILVKFWKGKK